jgi:hypothetical protein
LRVRRGRKCEVNNPSWYDGARFNKEFAGVPFDILIPNDKPSLLNGSPVLPLPSFDQLVIPINGPVKTVY